MAAERPRGSTPRPVIGKAGRYTVFITPPPASKPSEAPRAESARPAKASPLLVDALHSPLPVQVPPKQFDKVDANSSGSVFGFFWDAIARVQDAHSSLDEHLADWFGLNQSKYQWALNDYYGNNGKICGSACSRKCIAAYAKEP
ncbi:unnamed protein product [Musa acuminata subsp. malaccensis]|uniref:(wild Malaysian banana) hypothetical protein n=1 Tax=Musa acuminata subsp. malaccensis TaxID=214687 RepID=A0A804KZJ1_MUSAM|nr:PREDICTED: uncharacterized protein LOC103969867 [Musa acuminata subsp. malaccensis]CAG1854403.1 unnamed protein product [Musa acuminata subsp. malaccensis]